MQIFEGVQCPIFLIRRDIEERRYAFLVKSVQYVFTGIDFSTDPLFPGHPLYGYRANKAVVFYVSFRQNVLQQMVQGYFHNNEQVVVISTNHVLNRSLCVIRYTRCLQHENLVITQIIYLYEPAGPLTLCNYR